MRKGWKVWQTGRNDDMDNCKAWDYAIGIVQVDGTKPSDEFLELVEKEKRGEITSEDIRKAIQEDRLLDFKEEFLNQYGRDVYERAF